jgi:glucose/arabinose dehydrogenase
MLNFGKKKKTIKFLLLSLSLAFTACSANPPQAFSTLTPQPSLIVEEQSHKPTASSTSTATETPQPTASHTATHTIIPTETPSPADMEAGPPPSSLPPASALSFPDPTIFTWQVIASGLQAPVAIAHAKDNTGRLFIVEKAGRIRIVKDGNLVEEPFLNIQEKVGSGSSEQGLLGLDFHPAYLDNGFFFVNYTDLNGNTVISRFQVRQDNPDQAEPGSEELLLFINQPYPNHNGGSVVFGPDGFLYLGLGDGGAGGDPQDNAENPDTLLGKILRINVDSEQTYTIPLDNPFVNGGGKSEIWALGLRNPWRFSFDRLTGELYIADVGQNQWEEINVLPAGSPGGANFGWDFLEGTHPFEGIPPAGLIPPVFEYDHSQGCSITGGYVYRGNSLPELSGIYLFGDYCTSNIWGLLRKDQVTWQAELLFQVGGNLTSFGEDEIGEIYLVAYPGELLKLTRLSP